MKKNTVLSELTPARVFADHLGGFSEAPQREGVTVQPGLRSEKTQIPERPLNHGDSLLL